MAKPKKISTKSAADYIKQKLEEKDIFLDAMRMGKDIKEIAKQRGINLIQPI